MQITWLTRDSKQAHPNDIKMMTYDELVKSDKSFDVILNLAGAGIADKRWSDARKEQLLASRIKPTEALLDFIEQPDADPQPQRPHLEEDRLAGVPPARLVQDGDSVAHPGDRDQQ